MSRSAVQTESKPAGTSVDSAGGGHRAAVKEVFLSPRVIDREAFNDYSQALRKLIEQAVSQADALRAAASAADHSREALGELLARSAAPRTEESGKTLAALEQRSGESERIFAAARDAAASLDALRVDSDGLITTHAAKLDDRIESAVRGFESRLSALEQKMTDAVEKRMAAACEQAIAQATEAARRLDETSGAVLTGLQREGQTAAAAVKSAAQESLAAVKTAGRDAAADIEGAVERLAAERTSAVDAVIRLEEMLGEAEAVIGAAELAGDGEEPVLVPGSLGDLLGKVQRAQAQAEGAIRQATTTREQAEDCRRTFLEIQAAAKNATEALQNHVRAAQDREQSAGAAREQVEQLAAKAAYANQLGEQTLVEVGRSVNDLSRLLEQLRPWRPLLLEGSTDPATLPAPLTDILDQVRGELARDLGQIAVRMRNIASASDGATGIT